MGPYLVAFAQVADQVKLRLLPVEGRQFGCMKGPPSLEYLQEKKEPEQASPVEAMWHEKSHWYGIAGKSGSGKTHTLATLMLKRAGGRRERLRGEKAKAAVVRLGLTVGFICETAFLGGVKL